MDVEEEGKRLVKQSLEVINGGWREEEQQ